jgi:DNA-binding transcriptional ArsR family regulator
VAKRHVGKPSEEFDKVTGNNYYNTKRGYMVLRALNNKFRRKIIELIHENKRLNVEEIYDTLKIDQATASQQLRILRMAKIVNTQQSGYYTYYSINYSQMNQVNKLVTKFMESAQT